MRELAFTPEELEAMRLADEEIEREFYLSADDIAASNELDRAAQKKAYYEANREKINERRRRKYREKRIRNQDGV